MEDYGIEKDLTHLSSPFGGVHWCLFRTSPTIHLTDNNQRKSQTERKGHFFWQQTATLPFQQSPHHPNCKLLLKVFNKPHSVFHSSAPCTRNHGHTAPVPRSQACWKDLGLLKDLLLTASCINITMLMVWRQSGMPKKKIRTTLGKTENALAIASQAEHAIPPKDLWNISSSRCVCVCVHVCLCVRVCLCACIHARVHACLCVCAFWLCFCFLLCNGLCAPVWNST